MFPLSVEPIPANRKVSSIPFHREKPDGIAIEFTLGKTDDLVALSQAQIPFDSPDVHEGWIKQAIERGECQAVTIAVDGVPSGLLTYSVRQHPDCRELLVVSAVMNDHRLPYLPIMQTAMRRIAVQNECKFIRFHTVRKGLVKQALALGFNVSEFVLRMPVSGQ